MREREKGVGGTETKCGFDIDNDRFSYAVDRVAPRLFHGRTSEMETARGIHMFPIFRTNETMDELDACDSDEDGYC